MSVTGKNIRDPDSELGGNFGGAVYRDHYRVVLASANNVALGFTAIHAPGIVEDPNDANALAGIIDLGSADGVRLVFVLEPGPTSPVFALYGLEPFGRTAATVPGQPAANNAAAYLQQPISDVAAVPLVEGTGAVGATLAAALNLDPVTVAAGYTALSTWVFAHQITAPGTPMTGVDRYSPGANQIAHFDFFPAQGVKFLRALIAQTTSTKKFLVLARRLRGDAQGT